MIWQGQDKKNKKKKKPKNKQTKNKNKKKKKKKKKKTDVIRTKAVLTLIIDPTRVFFVFLGRVFVVALILKALYLYIRLVVSPGSVWVTPFLF